MFFTARGINVYEMATHLICIEDQLQPNEARSITHIYNKIIPL